MVMIMVMLILIRLFSLSKMRNYIYTPVITLSAKNNQKLSKFLSKGFERSDIGIKINQNVKITTQQTSIDIFSNQTL